MSKVRGKFSKLLVLSMVAFGLVANVIPSVVLADNPNEHSAHHSLTGGWDKALTNRSGRHWTRYTQRESARQAYASIRLENYNQETGLGNYRTAYKKSNISTAEGHPHIHSGGAI